MAQTRFPISIPDQHDIVISGLEFRYNDPDDGGPHDNYVGNGSPSPCVRLLGNCANITVKNCKFYHVANAVVASLRPDGDGGPTNDKVMDNIIVSDNDIQHSERGGTISLVRRQPENQRRRLRPTQTCRGDAQPRHRYRLPLRLQPMVLHPRHLA